jgi:hypothetical protein
MHRFNLEGAAQIFICISLFLPHIGRTFSIANCERSYVAVRKSFGFSFIDRMMNGRVFL